MDLCLPAANASQGLTANPDISGIGVRTAVYTQAALSLVHPLAAGFDGQIKDYELKSLFTVYLGILLPGCALLLSSIIQAKTFGLSVYHGIIVLNLSWINNASALTFFTFVLGGGMISWKQEEERWFKRKARRGEVLAWWYQEWQMEPEKTLVMQLNTLAKVETILEKINQEVTEFRWPYHQRRLKLEIMEASLWRVKTQIAIMGTSQDAGDNEERAYILGNIQKDMKKHQDELLSKKLAELMPSWNQSYNSPVRRWLSKSAPIPKSVWLMATLASAHLTLLSGFGWWLWNAFPDFGIDQDCIPSTRFIFFFKSIPVTSSTLRSRTISIYKFSSLPAFNILVWIIAFVIISYLMGVFWKYLAKAARATKKWMRNKESVVAQDPDPGHDKDDIELGTLPFHSPNHSSSTVSHNTPPNADPTPAPQIRRVFGLNGRAFFFAAVTTTSIFQALIIAFTELTIRDNRPLLKNSVQDPREGDWTFRQTLAITLTIIPSLQVGEFLHQKYRRRKAAGKTFFW
ncbi:hypothetical protein NLJ89_g8984 [Agrocybe chaxingu]|uniref:Uncharacterized protein n=1 Tax=Agrocybe chaxingu TaxID=84603 RepID=A0A9W8JTX3_9AGAR|nr:hypothetical protein NLJ89_g8984 [Agrocybe chaxingu]